MKENIFEKIIKGELPCNKVYEDEHALAFHDLYPQAKVHVLIIPKIVLKTAKEVTEENKNLFGHLVLVAKKIAPELGLEDYKLMMNVGEASGQTVPHVHLHLLSPDYKSSL
ncbi:histidine triad nucleotide-binding protein [bacterium DOLZORAL124_38_8]|nr:MAG: histidine triad nucleotide-binding protein [bacterium DOLZORAL124_38_8]